MSNQDDPKKGSASPEIPESSGSDEPSGRDRRIHERFEVTWKVDCRSEHTFLFAYITNISELGIFVRTDEPQAIGSKVQLAFAPPGEKEFHLSGEVTWINPPTPQSISPGMGIRFVELDVRTRERIVKLVNTIAYLNAPN
ncbi:MAG: TIGR02266 family protein [Polyangiaceae bacterium]|nr:TIGR02266 family protein [Polyangiaceae bacterium]